MRKTRQLLNLSVLLMAVLFTACVSAGPPSVEATPTLEPDSDAAQGESLYRIYCATCHAIASDVVVVGPSLSGIATRAGIRVEGMSAEDYLYDSILNPNDYIVEGFSNGSMQQNFSTTLTSEEIDQIVAYLLTLR